MGSKTTWIVSSHLNGNASFQQFWGEKSVFIKEGDVVSVLGLTRKSERIGRECLFLQTNSERLFRDKNFNKTR